jgi:hypothetical protein
VKIELSIEQDYLKLLRLGSNVTNLIEMKAAERKNFTSDLLSDINIYNELYKKVSDDSKVLKNLLKSVGDKINKLNVVDVDMLNDSIVELDKELLVYSKRKDELQTKIGMLDGQLISIIPEGLEVFDDAMANCSAEMCIVDDDIKRKTKERDMVTIILDCDIDDYINGIDIRINGLKNELQSNSTMSSFYKDRLNELYNRRDELLVKLKRYTSDLEYAQLASLEIDLRKKYESYKKKFENFIPADSKDNVLVMLNILVEINNIASTIYEFDNTAITEFIKLVKDGIDVDSFVKKEISKIDKEIMMCGSNIDSEFIENDVIILFRPSGCEFDTCPYLNLYKRMYDTTGDNKSESPSVESLKNRRDNLSMLIDINRNFEYILMIIKSVMLVWKPSKFGK